MRLRQQYSALIQNAVVVQVAIELHRRIKTAYSTASVTTIVRRSVGAAQPSASSEANDGASTQTEASEQSDGNSTAPEDTAAATEGDNTAVPDAPSTRSAARQRSLVYRGVTRLNDAVHRASVYRWLTAEPEPEVIVIDLRETRTIGPFLVRLESVIGQNTQALRTSRLAGVGTRISTRFRRRPVRLLSIVVTLIALLTLSVLTLTETTSPVAVLGLLATLLVGLRGTQSSMSLEELQQQRWVRFFRRVFSPPPPPE